MPRGPRYLKLRHRTWYFQLDVPEDVRSYFDGKPKIVKTTGCHSLADAQPLALRWAGEYKTQFNHLRAAAGGVGAAPRDVYRRKLDALDAGQFDVALLDGGGDPDDPYYDPDGERVSIEIDMLLADAPKGASGAPVLDPVAQAKLDALTDYTRRRHGRTPPRRDEYGLPFSEAARLCIEQKAKEISGQTKVQYESTYRLFADFVEDKAIRLVTQQNAAKFIDEVSAFAPHWGTAP